MHLASIDYTSRTWEELPADHRAEIRLWMDTFRNAPRKGITTWLRQVAVLMGCGYSTARRKWDTVQASGWTALIDNRKADSDEIRTDGTASPAFRGELVRLVEKNQRKSAPAIRVLRQRWLARKIAIPGYESWQGWPEMPVGWTTRNLNRIIAEETNRARLASVRIGTSSKTNPFLPTVHTTRVGLWPGAVVQFDDQWHDNFVTLGRKRESVRVLELGALDLLSGHRFHWGAKPRRKTVAGGFENIRTRDMRLFVAGMLRTYGHSSNGSMWMVEHGTAAISEDIEKLLYDATRGLIRIERQPIEGKQAALSGYWNGTEGGNFRAKACLESTHNRIRNDMAMLPGQTGKDSASRPVTTDRILHYIGRIVADVLKKVPEREHLLRVPLWDFHTQLIPWLTDYYQFGLGSRTEHDLEGWERLGHVVTEYTTAPGCGQWLGEGEYLKLPEESQAIIGASARKDPAAWTRRRNLSPLEVWDRRTDFQHVQPSLICEMLTSELSREVTVRHGFAEFSDLELSPDELIYKARFISGPRARQEIPHGEKIEIFANPFDDATAFVVDAKGRYQGQLALYKRILPIDADAFHAEQPWESRPDIRSQELKRAAGEKHESIAATLHPSRILHAEEVQAARTMREHNARLLDPDQPATPEEKAAARDQRRAASFGHAVRAAHTPAPATAAPTGPVEEWPDDIATPSAPSTSPTKSESW